MKGEEGERSEKGETVMKGERKERERGGCVMCGRDGKQAGEKS